MDRRHFLGRASRYAAAASAGALVAQTAQAVDSQWEQAAAAMDAQWQKTHQALRDELSDLKAEYAAMDKRSKLMLRAVLALAGLDALLLI